MAAVHRPVNDVERTMTGLKNLINEAHRRSLWQVLGIYVVASCLVFQVAQKLTEGLGLPDAPSGVRA